MRVLLFVAFLLLAAAAVLLAHAIRTAPEATAILSDLHAERAKPQ